MSEEIKALFPEGVETLTISKNDYDRLYGQLTYENIILQQKVEQLENIRKEAIEYLKKREYDNYSCSVCSVISDDLLNILNKGDNKE